MFVSLDLISVQGNSFSGKDLVWWKTKCMHLQVLDSAVQKDLFGGRKKITRWMKDVENATMPHFADVHTLIFDVAKGLKAEEQQK